MDKKIVSTAIVDDNAVIGSGTVVWHHSQIRDDSFIGHQCNIAKNVYIDKGVIIGNKCKIQNNVNIYNGVVLEDGVFVGPSVTFTNDILPRAVNPDMSLKLADDWKLSKTIVRKGASIGAGATICCGLEIGEWSIIGCGTTISRNVSPHSIVVGHDRIIGYICRCTKTRSSEYEELQCECMNNDV